MSFLTALQAAGQEAGFSFSERQLEQFELYNNLLVEKNKVMNLTAITEPEEVAVKHMIDSLLVYEQGQFENKTLVDVGTGAGFPGIPLKIYCPTLRVTLIDSLAKRLGFLEEVIAALDLQYIRCVHLRAEEAGQKEQHREQYDIVVARAVANLPVLAEYCLPLAKVGGTFYAMKGSKYLEEAEAAGTALQILGGKLESATPVSLPGLNDGRGIVKIKKIKRTPKAYPRKAGTPTKKSL